MYRDKNHDLCSTVQKLRGVMRQKAGNWQPSWILAAILIILIRLLDTDQNCSLDPYPQICIEN